MSGPPSRSTNATAGDRAPSTITGRPGAWRSSDDTDRRDPTPARLVTCEHGGNAVPRRWRAPFSDHQELLSGHRGWDPGALATAVLLAAKLDATLIASTTSRLLVDLNRSLHHPRLFSELSALHPAAVRGAIVREHWLPYRRQVEQWVRAELAGGRWVLHLSAHSFAAQWNGALRRADVGLLYDPASTLEARLCRQWEAALSSLPARWRVRRNYPYRGRSDGLTTHLRRELGPRRYAGIELELNQGLLGGELAAALREDVAGALLEVLSR